MRKTLILFAHPRLEKSRINRKLLESIPKDLPVTLHDLYETYPDFNIDIEAEKKLLLEHEVIIWQHPFYWYSCPALLKQWIDMVLEIGWAYGPGGHQLSGKSAFNVITTGGPQEAYTHEGRHRFTIEELLAPFNQTAFLCQMNYLPPFSIQGTHRLTDVEVEQHALRFEQMLRKTVEGVFVES
jgi:glutathione-regulated potassium-efflux system ancillary protein KefG